MKLQKLDSAVVNILTGKAFEHEDGELTFRRAAVMAILAPTEEKESDETKFKKYQLATKLQRDNEPELETTQVADIRKGSAVYWGVAVHGALAEYLESQAK